MQTVVRGELEGGKRVVVGWMKGGVADDSWFDGNCLVSRADRKYYRSGWGSGAGCWVSDDVGEEERAGVTVSESFLINIAMVWSHPQQHSGWSARHGGTARGRGKGRDGGVASVRLPEGANVPSLSDDRCMRGTRGGRGVAPKHITWGTMHSLGSVVVAGLAVCRAISKRGDGQ